MNARRARRRGARGARESGSEAVDALVKPMQFGRRRSPRRDRVMSVRRDRCLTSPTRVNASRPCVARAIVLRTAAAGQRDDREIDLRAVPPGFELGNPSIGSVLRLTRWIAPRSRWILTLRMIYRRCRAAASRRSRPIADANDDGLDCARFRWALNPAFHARRRVRNLSNRSSDSVLTPFVVDAVVVRAPASAASCSHGEMVSGVGANRRAIRGPARSCRRTTYCTAPAPAFRRRTRPVSIMSMRANPISSACASSRRRKDPAHPGNAERRRRRRDMRRGGHFKPPAERRPQCGNDVGTRPRAIASTDPV